MLNINHLTALPSNVIHKIWVLCIPFVTSGKGKMIMREWLEKQKKQEKSMLDAVGIQCRQVADELVP